MMISLPGVSSNTVVWRGNIWCILRVKPPFSDFSGVVWTGPQAEGTELRYKVTSKASKQSFIIVFYTCFMDYWFNFVNCFIGRSSSSSLIFIYSKNFNIKMLFFKVVAKTTCIKSVNPKISRIGRQKRKNEFFLIWPKKTHLVTCFRKWHQKVRFPFLFLEICKTWNFGHEAFSCGHETWNLTHV